MLHLPSTAWLLRLRLRRLLLMTLAELRLTPVMTASADPVCEGTKVYTFTYTDCAGNSAVGPILIPSISLRSPSAAEWCLYRELPGPGRCANTACGQ